MYWTSACVLPSSFEVHKRLAGASWHINSIKRVPVWSKHVLRVLRSPLSPPHLTFLIPTSSLGPTALTQSATQQAHPPTLVTPTAVSRKPSSSMAPDTEQPSSGPDTARSSNASRLGTKLRTWKERMKCRTERRHIRHVPEEGRDMMKMNAHCQSQDAVGGCRRRQEYLLSMY